MEQLIYEYQQSFNVSRLFNLMTQNDSSRSYQVINEGTDDQFVCCATKYFANKSVSLFLRFCTVILDHYPEQLLFGYVLF